ncbi:MAG: hypothetical protein IKC08_02175, partial [Lentisphaeria bacterium]|nr:hypothetical protein [Lentisphaeria bacterium]
PFENIVEEKNISVETLPEEKKEASPETYPAQEAAEEKKNEEESFPADTKDPEKIWEYLALLARKDKKISLAELMLLGVPQRVEGVELVIAFDQEYGETALTAVCSEIYYLMEKLAKITRLAEFKFVRIPGIRSYTGATREKALDDLKKEVSNNETVKAVADIFGGRILDVLEEIPKE